MPQAGSSKVCPNSFLEDPAGGGKEYASTQKQIRIEVTIKKNIIFFILSILAAKHFDISFFRCIRIHMNNSPQNKSNEITTRVNKKNTLKRDKKNA
jgi:hypothetical protein